MVFAAGRRGRRAASSLQVTIECQVFAGYRLGQKDNLPGVHGEVLDDVIDRCQYCQSVVLNVASLGQASFGERLDQGAGLLDGSAEIPQQLFFAGAAASRELSVAMAQVRLASDAMENPLADVTGQMKAEIAARVGTVASTQPELLVAELLDAGLDALVRLAHSDGGTLEEISLDSHAFDAKT